MAAGASCAATGMYVLKPVNQTISDILLPTGMYKLKNLHADFNSTVKGCDSRESVAAGADIQTLAARQDNILHDLNQLRNEVQELTRQLGGSVENLPPAVVNPAKRIVKVAHAEPPVLPDGVLDFVITLSPSKPSITPVFIASVLRSRGVDVSTPTHLHSSLNEPLPDYLQKMTGGVAGCVKHGRSKVMLTFIWKSDPFCPCLMLSPGLQTRIYGDVNIARCLARILAPDLYDAGSLDLTTEIDRWLDVASQVSSGSGKEKESCMKTLNAHLGRQTTLTGSGRSLADLAVCAALIGCKASFATLPKNVKKWFQELVGDFAKLIESLDVPSSWMS